MTALRRGDASFSLFLLEVYDLVSDSCMAGWEVASLRE